MDNTTLDDACDVAMMLSYLLQLVLPPQIYKSQKVCIKMFRCILILKMSCKEPENIF